MPGEKIGQYEITDHIGRGGMADVYKAIHPGLGVNRAIKVIRAELVTSVDFRARFQKEAHTVAEMRHPNIVTVHDFGSQDDRFYMVMEFIEGQDLRQVLESEGRIRPISRALNIVIKVAAALEYAHERDLVHRDIKPDNIMLSKDGAPILMDFGIAKLLTSETQLTQKGLGIGTPAYIAPEQATALADIGPAVDIYSLSVVLYEMLTGTVPFVADTAMAVIFKAINDPLPPPRDICEDISEELQQVIIKGTAKNPEDRFSSVKEFREALELIVNAGDSNATYVRPVPPGATNAGGRKGTSRAMLVSIAAAVLIGAVALVGVLYPWSRESVPTTDDALAADTVAESSHPIDLMTLTSELVAAGPDALRVGVHPFVVVGDLPATLDHLGTSLAQEVIYSLGKANGLQVVFRGEELAPEQRARPVDVTLRGEIQLTGGTGMQSARLESSDGDAIWSEAYDFSMQSAFDTQQSIATSVAAALASISGGEVDLQPYAGPKPLADAYQQFLHGSLLMQKRGAQPMDESIQLFRRALDADPTFARAHLAMAYVYVTFPTYANRGEVEAFELAEVAVARALERDPGLSGEVTGIRAFIALRRWQWAESRDLFEQALSEEPNSAPIHGFYSQMLASIGDVDGALTHASRAWDLNAYSPIVNAQLAVSLMWKGALDDAERQFQMGDQLGLQDLGSPGRLLLLRLQNKEAATGLAIEQLHEGFGMPSDWVQPVMKGIFNPAYRTQAVEAFDAAIRADSVMPRLHWPMWVMLKNYDRAIAAFERYAGAEQYLYLDVEFLSSAECDEFRADPRYAALAGRYGLPQRSTR